MVHVRKTLRRQMTRSQHASRSIGDIGGGLLDVTVQVQTNDSHRETGIELEVLAGLEPVGTEEVRVCARRSQPHGEVEDETTRAELLDISEQLDCGTISMSAIISRFSDLREQ